jgi:hypothetical protein
LRTFAVLRGNLRLTAVFRFSCRAAWVLGAH